MSSRKQTRSVFWVFLSRLWPRWKDALGRCQTNLNRPAKGAGLRRSGRQLTPLGQGGGTVLFETVEVWAFDEHSLGLKPIRRRVWARKSQRPIARVNHRYQWLYTKGP